MVSATRRTFDRIFSIELDAQLYARATRRFAKYRHITIMEGDSCHALACILAEVRSPCLFWLDAHFSGGSTARGASDTPIMRELQQIAEPDTRSHIILIDDARLFGSAPDYPSIDRMIEAVADKFPNHTFDVQDDIIRICPRRQTSR